MILFLFFVGKMYGDVHEEESSIDVSSPRENNSPSVCLVSYLII